MRKKYKQQIHWQESVLIPQQKLKAITPTPLTLNNDQYRLHLVEPGQKPHVLSSDEIHMSCRRNILKTAEKDQYSDCLDEIHVGQKEHFQNTSKI